MLGVESLIFLSVMMGKLDICCFVKIEECCCVVVGNFFLEFEVVESCFDVYEGCVFVEIERIVGVDY